MEEILKLGKVTYGRATKKDDPVEILERIWGCDEYIYPFWRENVDDFVTLMLPFMNKRGFIFSLENIRVARMDGHVVAAMVTIDNRSNREYDYTDLRNHDERSRRIVDEYISGVLKTVHTLSPTALCGVALSVQENLRHAGIGRKLFESTVRDAIRKGYRTLVFDCLADNQSALNLYKKQGCMEMCNGTGFGKDPNEPPEIVTLALSFFG